MKYHISKILKTLIVRLLRDLSVSFIFSVLKPCAKSFLIRGPECTAPAAPRFIFFDDNKNFIFGVGGYVQLSGVYDFNGVEDYNFFTTSTIAMKGHQPGASYGMTVGQSRLFFKLVGNTDVGRLVSYIEMEFQGPQNTPKLQQAFVQFKGFTLGQAWSTFGDMTAVPIFYPYPLHLPV